jgi:hypothetical protein
MQDIQAHLEKLRQEAANCRRISDHATDKKKRELFSRLADHLNVLAGELARVVESANKAGDELCVEPGPDHHTETSG